MKRREGKGAPTDLLVCFPTRSHLTIMPKAICSPVQASGPNNNSKHHRRKSSIGGGGSIGGASTGSPYMSKQMGPDYSEPTSPKVTCAGQIKMRPRPGPCKSWQSVMEDIERLHNNKQKKRSSWVGPLGFLTCLRSLKFDFRCLGSFPHVNVTSDHDEDDDEEEEEEEEGNHHQHIQQELDDQEGSSKAVFSKWFVALQENQHPGVVKEEKSKDHDLERESDDPPCGAPPNALMLMRCRSAPAKSWQEEKEEEEYEKEKESKDKAMEKRKLEEEIEKKRNFELREEENEKKKKREILEELMRYESDFYKLSSDIAKETWVVGGIKDALARSRSRSIKR